MDRKTAEHQVNAAARTFQERDPTLTHAQAVARALAANPQLYTDYDRAPKDEPARVREPRPGPGRYEAAALGAVGQAAAPYERQGLSPAQAIARVFHERPDLYDQYERARRVDRFAQETGATPAAGEQPLSVQLRTFAEPQPRRVAARVAGAFAEQPAAVRRMLAAAIGGALATRYPEKSDAAIFEETADRLGRWGLLS